MSFTACPILQSSLPQPRGKIITSRSLRPVLTAIVATTTLTLSTIAHAQTAEPAHDPPPLGTTFTESALANLPVSGNLLSLIDATLADVIADRVDGSGLSVGSAARIGAHGSTWTQTAFRLGEIDITDPDGSGTPLLVPGVLEWRRVDVFTGMMPGGINAPGLAVSLVPKRPGQTWTGAVEFVDALRRFDGTPAGGSPPAAARLHSFGSGNLLLGGPIIPNRLGAVFAGTWTDSSRYERADPTRVRASLGSAFLHLVYTPTTRDEVRWIAWGQRAKTPSDNRLAFGQPSSTDTSSSAHVQMAWARRTNRSALWTTFGGVTQRERSRDLVPTTSIVVERLRDGPPAGLLYPGTGTDRQWSVGTRVERATVGRGLGHHTLVGETELGRGSVRTRQAFSGLIGELVDGLPARVWSYSAPQGDSRWRETTFAAYLSDRWQVTRRLSLDGGVRFESIRGSSATNPTSISWNDILPRAGIRVELFDWKHIAALANYTRTAHRLPLADLAWGDRSAPDGTVYRWNASSADHAPLPGELGTLIQRVGPGPGSASLTSIDPSLKRPHMDEIVIGIEARPSRSSAIRFSAMASRQRQLVQVVDTGVPASTYGVSTVPDPGVDLFKSGDDQLLPLLNRDPATFGLDRYVLTNPANDEATLVGVDLSGQASTERLFVLVGLTASRSEGLAANVGFLPVENDIGVIGDLFIDPNSREHAQGRLFTERGYTAKVSTAYQFGHEIRAGIAARYQDGEHFARLVLAPDLNQGPELVRAFRNGHTRFSYTMTVDARVQKTFALGAVRMTAIVDAYNLFNQSSEIEEFPVTGPQSRTTVATQPPRAVHVGLRVEF